MQYRKRIAQALIVAGLTIVLTVGSASAASGTAVVSASALRMRQGPSTSTATVTTLIQGTEVTVLAPEENGWYKVSYRNYTGYMSAEYLTIKVAPSADAPTKAPDNTNTDTNDNTADMSTSEFTAFTGVVNAGPLNVRSGPGTGHSRVGILNTGTRLTVTGVDGDWYQIKTDKLTGYVFAQYVSKEATASAGSGTTTSGNTSGSVNTSTPTTHSYTPIHSDGSTKAGMVLKGPVNVRSGPGAGYTLLGKLNIGTELTVYGTSNGWYKITCGNYDGFVHAGYVIFMEDLKSSSVGDSAAAMAKVLVGSPYVYGAEGPNSFDCSGLTYYIYGKLGYSLARGSSGQYLRSGRFVPISEIEPGDLVFIFDPKYDFSGGQYPTTHMGIYVGDGKFIHASSDSGKVMYENLYGSYFTPYIVGIKRVG